MVQAWQTGALSRDSMLDIFRGGAVLPKEMANEEETRLIEASEPDVARGRDAPSGL